MEAESTRESKLFFSKIDDQFFIAVQDISDGYVVTVLTLEYWHNLSKKYFSYKRVVEKRKLIEAVKVADPDNPLILHTPICDSRVVNFACMIIMIPDGRIIALNCGSVDIRLFESTSVDELVEIIQLSFDEKINIKIKKLKKYSVASIRWGIGKEAKLNEVSFDGSIDYLKLVNSVSRDIHMRRALAKRYEDFLELLNRTKKINSDSGSEK
jgi:hypothetical protein